MDRSLESRDESGQNERNRNAPLTCFEAQIFFGNNNGGDTLKVIFDAYWLVQGPPSGRTVVREMIRAWNRSFPDDIITLFVRECDSAAVRDLDFVKRGAFQVLTSRIKVHGVAVTALRVQGTYDALVSQNFTPLLPLRLVKATFLHDAIFKQHPEWFTKSERLYLALASFSIRLADLVFTSTRTESKRIKKYLPTTASKVRAVGLGLPSWILEEGTGSLEAQQQPRPYLLAVGRLNVRKNLSSLIRAFEAGPLAARFDLLLVGEPNGKATSLAGKSSAVRFMSGVSDSTLRELYAGAAAFVFPSLDEGFGLPLLEAANFNIPIAASDLEVFREIDLAQEYFDPKSVESISAALDRITDKTERYSQDRLQDRRKLALDRFNWTRVVGNIRQVITMEMER